VDGALWGAFANAGQCGGSIERAFVLEDVFPRFLAGVVAGASGLRVGDRATRAAVGPLVDAARRERVRALVDEAVAAGRDAALRGPSRCGRRGACSPRRS
jgi:acyl-CoA reductase-like NAD-dependent aldehyde dehydrogenase